MKAMFAETINEFAGYLNETGYAVTPDKTAQCIEAFAEEDLDCMDVRDVTDTMRFYFCKDRHQRDDLPKHFQNFIRQKDALIAAKKKTEEASEKESERNRHEVAHERARSELNNRILELEVQAKEIEERVRREWKPDPAKFTRTDLNFLNKKKDWIDSLDMPDVEDILSGKGISVKDSENAQRTILKMAEDAMKSGDMARMKDLNRLFGILKKVKTAKVNEAPRMEAAVRKATSETVKAIETLQQQKKREEMEHMRLQNLLTRQIQQLRSASIIVKPEAIQHRREFKDAQNAVRTLNHIECPPEAEKEFKKLSEEDKRIIYRYIRENVLKFKTRMTRSILDLNTGRIDMERTIQNACRTGGLPMEIYKELKKPGKTNLILILDVSGSCKEASEMMITFMYLLQSVFPRGCSAYAFVNSLFDITKTMESENAEAAIKETLRIIPRAGQYSNYEKPITAMWENNRSKITPESIVIMIGDGRNNKNASAENEFRNIVRRAKKTYWLNTDVLSKWGQGDSIAPTYAKYCNMYEVRTPKAIVQFLDQGMK